MNGNCCDVCNCPDAFWLTAKQVAKGLRISKSQIYLMVQSGTLKAIRFGRVCRIKHASVHEYLITAEEVV